jgi:hypothetical protein
MYIPHSYSLHYIMADYGRQQWSIMKEEQVLVRDLLFSLTRRRKEYL